MKINSKFGKGKARSIFLKWSRETTEVCYLLLQKASMVI